MRKCVSLILIFGIILVSSSVFAMKTFDATEGSSLTLDNGACEVIKLEFDEGEAKTFTLQGKSFTVKYLGAKVIDYNYDSQDYSGIPFLNNGEKKNSENAAIESIYEFEGKEYRHLGDVFSNKLDGFYFPEDSGANTEAEWTNDNYDERYMGTAKIEISEQELTTDCEGFDDRNQWGNQYIDAIKFYDGWNLVPTRTRVDRCGNKAQSQICYNDFLDKPIMYLFEPVDKKYYTEEWIENFADSKGNDYWNEYEKDLQEKMLAELEERGLSESSFNGEEIDTSLDFFIDILKDGEMIVNIMEFDDFFQGAQWVYVTEELAGKYVKQNSHMVMNNAFGIALFEGWNLQYVYPDYIFRGQGNYELRSRSLNDLKGTCDIEGAFFFDAATQEWEVLELDYKFVEEDLNKGISIKVKEDCRIGKLRSVQGAPPGFIDANA